MPLEWYDFTVFGFLTVVIAQLFFPASNDYASLLLTTATFGVAFVMRPIGGIVLGLYADRAGRKAALSLVIIYPLFAWLAANPGVPKLILVQALCRSLCPAMTGRSAR